MINKIIHLIKIEKMKNRYYPILQALKKYNLNFNKNQSLNLPSNSNFGNLIRSWSQIVTRIHCVNTQIINLYTEFYYSQEEVKSKGYYENTLDQGYQEIMYTEQIFYWLRKTSDELISLISILTYFKTQNKYPDKIKISSIGEFLNKENPFDGSFNEFKYLLKILNDVSNAYKHSFLNSQFEQHHIEDYPIAFAYSHQYNDLTKQPEFYKVNLNDFLNNYDSFLETVKTYLKSNFELEEN
ncbi:hypothetical protein RRM46_000831 [Flavobacterium psychrophilum]|nr:hypothetical protein [Flavobacterium psychrophilum]ELY1978317.1 hypothetical protein [Flavobacterium psychrophilum]